MNLKNTIILIFFFSSNFSNAQLVNIESRRIQSDSIRKAGQANIHFAYQKNNNKSLMQLKTELAFQFKSKSLKDIFLILGNYQFATTRQQDLSNSAFGHLRYNRSLLPYLKYELFNQIQFNQLLNLRSRYIAGTGLRFKFSNKQVFKGYFGIGGFYEYEESIEDVRVFRNDFRQSNYLVLSIKFPNNKGEFSSTTYYQPLFKKYSDFRVSNQSSLVFNITKKIAFTTTFSYFYDAFPPEDIAKETISIDNGLRFQF